MNLFDTEGFVPRLHCGTSWTADLVFLDVLALITIIVGYAITSVRMYQLYRCRGVDEIKHNVTRLFIVFPICCSLSRVGSILAYWWAPYRLFIILDWICALAIIMLAFHLKQTVKSLLAYPTYSDQVLLNNQLSEEIKVRKNLQNQLETVNQTLLITIDRLETMLKSEVWLHDKKRAIDELNRIITGLSI